MADESAVQKVVTNQRQAEIDKLFVQKAERMQQLKSKQTLILKKRNNFLGLLLAGGVLGIYGYTVYATRQGKMMKAFDEAPE